MESSEYKELEDRVIGLLRSFLPSPHPLGIYSEIEQDKMRALRVLVHAEIEAYLELISKKLLDDLKQSIAGLPQKNKTILAWANEAIKQGGLAIGDNNGVTKNDIIKLFRHYGLSEVDYEHVSPVFLDRLSSFGKCRGDVAHQSAMRTTHSLNMKREEATIKELLQLLANFDKIIINKLLFGVIHT